MSNLRPPRGNRSVIDSSRRATRPQRPRNGETPPSKATTARIFLGNALRSENSNYYMLLGTVVFLVIFGLIIVFSASSIGSFLSDSGFFGGFLKQAGFAALGIPLMLIIAKLPLVFWARWLKVMLLSAFILQFLVVFTPLGVETGGNRNWLAIGSITGQPSELVKIVIAVSLGVALPKAIDRVGMTTWHVLFPIIPAVGLMALVLYGKDLGTTIIMAIIVVGGLLFAGLPMRILLIPATLGALGILVMAWTSSNRMDRILSFMNECTDYINACWQPLHGKWAMANGGIFGVGLGNSKSKWSWLPAADNDYIFAIIGEEMGLIGCLVVIALYVLLTVIFLRIIRESDNRMVRITTGAIMFWIIGQAAINIGVVVGILPVLGVPLPFLSSGGTALFANLVAVGIVLSFARANRDSRRTPGASVRRSVTQRQQSPARTVAAPRGSQRTSLRSDWQT
jgi:cell division protein FtsW